VRLRAMSFDLFGTLLLYGDMAAAWEDWLVALHGSLLSAGFDIARDPLAAACDGFFGRPEPPPADDGLTVYERRVGVLCSELGADLPTERVRLMAYESVSAWQRHVTPDPDAGATLEALSRRLPLVLVTNFDHPPHVLRVLAEAELSSFFEAVVISGEVGFKKPDPQIFSVALERLGEPLAAEMAHVGDGQEDARGAADAGILPIRIRRAPEGGSTPATDFRHGTSPPSSAWSHDGPTIARLSDLRGLVE